jgi:hypothetical protein
MARKKPPRKLPDLDPNGPPEPTESRASVQLRMLNEEVALLRAENTVLLSAHARSVARYDVWFRSLVSRTFLFSLLM